MAKSRVIKPEFNQSETIVGLPHAARLTFIGMWMEADDYGNLPDKPGVLKGHIWPLDNTVSAADVTEHIGLMSAVGLVDRYEVEGRPYLRIRNWDEHQKMPRRSARRSPASPAEHIGEPPQPVDNSVSAVNCSVDAVNCSVDAVKFAAHIESGRESESENESGSGSSLSPLAVDEKSSSSSSSRGPLSSEVIHRACGCDLAEQRDDDDRDDDDDDLEQSPSDTDTDTDTDTEDPRPAAAVARLGQLDHAKALADGVRIRNRTAHEDGCIRRRQVDLGQAQVLASDHPEWSTEQIAGHILDPDAAKKAAARDRINKALGAA